MTTTLIDVRKASVEAGWTCVLRSFMGRVRYLWTGVIKTLSVGQKQGDDISNKADNTDNDITDRGNENGHGNTMMAEMTMLMRMTAIVMMVAVCDGPFY